MTNLYASLIEEGIVPMMAVMMIFGIPIVAILTSHQRKMTELIHQRHNALPDQMQQALLSEVQSLRAEVIQLRDQVNRQAIAQDQSNPIPPIPVLEQRT